MGSCHQTEKTNKNSQTQVQSQPQPLSQSRTQSQLHLREKLHQSELNAPEPERNQSVFKDMPEYPGEIYKGYGIKRMKAYKCTLNIKDLTKLRDDFWGKHSLYNPIASKKQKQPEEWTIMHQACVFDHSIILFISNTTYIAKAEIYLANNNFRTLNGCINTCVDEYNNIYYVPNFCINDPYFEKEIKPIDTTTPHDKRSEVTIRDLYLGKNITLKVNSDITGIELKQLYAKEIDCNVNVNKSKLIFGGCIIQDSEFLYQHDIKDGFTIQIMTIKDEESSSE